MGADRVAHMTVTATVAKTSRKAILGASILAYLLGLVINWRDIPIQFEALGDTFTYSGFLELSYLLAIVYVAIYLLSNVRTKVDRHIGE